MERLFEFAGRFHPLLVHLPIGFLLIAVVFIWIKEPGRAVKIAVILGAIAAVASVTTGLLLANSEGYQEEVNLHKWSGITLAVVSVAMCFVPEQYLKPGSIVMTVLVFATGHFGGTLTHGPLIAEPEADNLDITKIDISSAVFYNDAIRPVLEARCYSCHGNTKQKGGLRLDNPEMIAKGGKNGKVIEPGNPEESDLIKRIDLPNDDEDHMPPKEKRQLTDQEKKIISLWVASGADFSKKIAELLNEKQLASITAVDNSIQLPDVDVAAPAGDLIAKLTEQGVAVTPVANGSNFLQVNFISVPNEASMLLATLKPIAKNIVMLKLNKTKINDQSMMMEFENLTSLNLAETEITDATIDQIIKSKFLVSLNLSGTKVTAAGVNKLKALQSLRYLNVYNTSVDKADLPGVKIETGNYEVPTLASDTTVITPKTN